MKLTELYVAQLEREAPRSLRALEAVPEGKDDWKPHPKSMPLGPLARLVATMPSWVQMIIGMDALDIGGGGPTAAATTRAELRAMHEKSMADALAALRGTNDDYLQTSWRLLVAGKTVMEEKRQFVIEDTLMHLAHHRGQLTVYLRLNDAAVPSIYGPTADDQRFA
jgi:uncharacterized damage-inducible protein DinB